MTHNNIEYLREKHNLADVGLDVGDGWLKLIDRTLTDVDYAAHIHNVSYIVSDIERRNGGLRIKVIFDHPNERGLRTICAILEDCETSSYKICETCGTFINITFYEDTFTVRCPGCREREVHANVAESE